MVVGWWIGGFWGVSRLSCFFFASDGGVRCVPAEEAVVLLAAVRAFVVMSKLGAHCASLLCLAVLARVRFNFLAVEAYEFLLYVGLRPIPGDGSILVNPSFYSVRYNSRAFDEY